MPNIDRRRSNAEDRKGSSMTRPQLGIDGASLNYTTRDLTAAERNYLRDYMADVRTRNELARRRAVLAPAVPLTDAIGMMLIAAFIGFMLAVVV
jgi:hypothetical protein